MKNYGIKYLLGALSFLIIANTIQAQEDVNWITWQEAMIAAEETPKKIYVDIYTDWCGYCKKMDKTTFKDATVVKYLNDNFYAVKFNAEQKGNILFNDTEFKYINSGGRGVHELAYALLNGRLGYPAFVVLDEEFARILISPGYKGPDAVMMEMKFAKEEMYKTTSWQSYQAKQKALQQTAINQQANPQGNAAAASQATKTRTAPGQNTKETKAPAKSSMENQNEEIFKVVEEMPRFPGCEDKDLDKSELKDCANQEMLKFIYGNLEYPETARNNKVEGMVVIQYLVDQTGAIKNAKIVRDIGNGCGEAALKVINAMPTWIPGKQRGKTVSVLYNLPVRFKLESSSSVQSKDSMQENDETITEKDKKKNKNKRKSKEN